MPAACPASGRTPGPRPAEPMARRGRRVGSFTAKLVLTGLLALAWAWLQPANGAQAQAGPGPDCRPSPTAPALAVGVNLLGHSPYWSGKADGRFRLDHLARIRARGFDFIRLNAGVLAAARAGGAELDAAFERIDTVLGAAQDAGLSVVLDVHDSRDCAADPAACRAALGRFWPALAERYRGRLPGLLFELLNEPNNAIGPDDWNAWVADLVQAVRAVDRERWLVIDTAQWASVGALEALRLPRDTHRLIASVHYYEPHRFTHQGTPWSEASLRETSGVSLSPADADRIEADFARVARWSAGQGVPVLLGEYGAYDSIDLEQRARYTRDVSAAAARHCIPRAVWQFGKDFRVYDFAREAWLEPIVDAVMLR